MCGCAGGLWRARQEMGKLLRSYDGSSADETLLRSLAGCGCADVAAILAANDNATQVDSCMTICSPCRIEKACLLLFLALFMSL